MSISLPLLLVAFLQPPLHAVAPRAPSRTAVPTCAAEKRPNFALKLGTSVAAALMVLGSPRRALAGGAEDEHLLAARAPVAGRLVADGAAERAAAGGGPQRVRVAAKTAPAEEATPDGVLDVEKDLGAGPARAFAERFQHSDFIFSESLTARSELEEELDDLATYRTETKTVRRAQTTVTFVGAGALIYAGINFLKGFQAWMLKLEQRDIQEEIKVRAAARPPAARRRLPTRRRRPRARAVSTNPLSPPPPQLTGQYISYDASDVEYVIDAATGKNMTVAGSKADKSKEDDVEKPPPPPPPKWMPGFIANAKAADDADFFEAAKPQQSIKREGFDEDGGGGAGPGPVRLDGDDDEPDDDSGDLDDLDDLLG
jgi:hypothetical protein